MLVPCAHAVNGGAASHTADQNQNDGWRERQER